MIVLQARNVHQALPEAVKLLADIGVERESRNGKVLVSPYPVTTVYTAPTERVEFHPERDSNPFFHLYEALWMLGGRNDLASLTAFVKRFREFSDDGVVLRGAYGHRWRRAFGFDQLRAVAANLRKDRDDRRQVAAMWDASIDLPEQEGKRDIPCSLVAHVQVNVRGALDLTVFCRSNDIAWGCYGANAVHFSVLQEYLAARVGVPVGTYYQVPDNWHAYVDVFEPLRVLADRGFQPHRVVQWPDPYESMSPFPLVADPERFDSELGMFLDEGTSALGYREPFIRKVAVPMLAAHEKMKARDFAAAGKIASKVAADDWRRAAQEWIERRRRRSLERDT